MTDEEFDKLCEEILKKQEPLGEPFDKILRDNLWDLYD